MKLLEDHVILLVICLAMVLVAYVLLALTGHGDAGVDLRLPLVALITAAAGLAKSKSQ
jgi:hypothetical protein